MSFESVEKFCLFIGPPRSGTSLVGSTLDAHPNIIISNELRLFLLFESLKPSQEMLFDIIKKISKNQYDQGRRGAGGYSYLIKNQYQGNSSLAKVVGNKSCDKTLDYIYNHPDKFDEFKSLVGVPIFFIHMTRNPYDVISAMLKKNIGFLLKDRNNKNSMFFDVLSEEYIDLHAHGYCVKKFDELCEKVSKITKNTIRIKHEQYIKTPSITLKSLLLLTNNSIILFLLE